MGRPPKGDKAMSPAERVKAARERQKELAVFAAVLADADPNPEAPADEYRAAVDRAREILGMPVHGPRVSVAKALAVENRKPNPIEEPVSSIPLEATKSFRRPFSPNFKKGKP